MSPNLKLTSLPDPTTFLNFDKKYYENNNNSNYFNDTINNNTIFLILEIFVPISLICIFLYESSHVFRYFLKYVIFCTLAVFYPIILLPICILRGKTVENILYCTLVVRKHVSHFLGLQWRLRGSHHLSQNQSFIIVSNHQSCIDLVGLIEMWPFVKKGTAVVKDELRWTGPFGLIAWLCGVVFIPRAKNSQQSKQILNNALEKIKRENTKIWIFPEGTRRNTGEIHDFKKGGFHMAISAKIPILPVVFTHYGFIDSERKYFDGGKVLVTVLPPIDTDSYNLEQIDQLMDDVKDKMTKVFHQSNEELEGMQFGKEHFALVD